MESSIFRHITLGTLVLACTACGQAGTDDSQPSQLSQLSSQLGPDDRYIVKFVDHSKGKQTLAPYGASVERDLPSIGATAVRLPAHAVQGLQNNPNVEYVEPDAKREPFALNSQILPYGISTVQARDPGFTSTPINPAAIKVCIIDSGIQLDHPDFKGMQINGYSDTTATNPWYVDKCGHGTHVAGTIAALDDPTGVVGVAPGVALHVVKVFGDNCAWSYASDLINALQKCRDAGAKVVSMSLGGGSSSRAEKAAFQSAYDAGVLSIAAAGNDGDTSYNYPASYTSVVSVAAVDANNDHAWFSNVNAQVELAAPGVGVISTFPWNKESVIVHGADSQVDDFIGGKKVAGASETRVTAILADGGDCSVPGADWTGKVVACSAPPAGALIENAQAQGAAGVVFANTLAGPFSVTGAITIPAVNTSDSASLLAAVGRTVTLSNKSTALGDPDGVGLDKKNGTSMATPHVSGAAALIWSKNPAWTNSAIRSAMQSTAFDLGPTGRDTGYGYGLVQAKAALLKLTEPPPQPSCTESGNACTLNSQCCSGTCGKKTKRCN